MPSESAVLSWMLAMPLAGGVVVLALPASQARSGLTGARTVTLVFALATLAVAIIAAIWVDFGASGPQLVLRIPWLPPADAQYAVGVDGLSTPLVLLAAALEVMACWASYGIKRGVKAYFALLLFFESAALGVLVALDLAVLLSFLLAGLLALHFLVRGWGTQRSEHAARIFLWHALAAAGIILAAYAGGGATAQAAGIWTLLLACGFAILLPLTPGHRWFGHVLAESATPVAMLAGAILPLLGACGLLRFCWPLWAPDSISAGWAAVLALACLIYAVLATLSQKDLHRVAASGAMAEAALVAVGLAAHNPVAVTGAVVLLVAQGLAIALLMFICGVVRDRVGHSQIDRLGGLGSHMPAFAGWSALGFLAALGMPGLCVFAGQLLVVLGVFQRIGGPGPWGLWTALTCVATMMLLAGGYLWTYQRAFLGPPRPEHSNVARLSLSEKCILGLLSVAALALGLMPMVLTRAMAAAVEAWVTGA